MRVCLSRGVRRDARLARTYGPSVVRGLTLRATQTTRSRLVNRRDPKHVQITDFDPLDPAIAADPYPHYRMLLAGARVHYNRKRDFYILSRYADVRDAARNDDVLRSASGVTFSRLCLPFLPTSDPPEHTRMRKQLLPVSPVAPWSPGVRRSTSSPESWSTGCEPGIRRRRLHGGRTDADAHHLRHSWRSESDQAASATGPSRWFESPTSACRRPECCRLVRASTDFGVCMRFSPKGCATAGY